MRRYTVGDALEEAEERLKDAAHDMSGDVKSMLAARTLKLREISARRQPYNRKLKWSSVLYQNLVGRCRLTLSNPR